jgi:23S rRNA (uracil1939-C5)-methyltransferase
MPGEKIRIRLVEEKRGHARAELLEVLEPAADRTSPICPHFRECGGCHYQHMTYPAQLAAKTEILKDQLIRLGGLKNPEINTIVASPQQSYYRNHVQFHLTPQGELGYHRSDHAGILPIRECYLPEPTLNELWPRLSFEPGQEIERIALRCGVDEDIQIILESSEITPPDFLIEDLPISAVHLGPAGPFVLAGGNTIFFQVLDKIFQVSAGSFFQVNTTMAGAMVQHLLETIPQFQPLGPQTTLLDVYCGVGLFSAFFADEVGRIIAIESSPSAAEDYVVNLDAYNSIELYEATAEAVLPSLDVKPDIVLVDPPRSGIDRRALDGLAQLNAPLIVYISCDPATLARDIKRLLTAGYQLAQATPFDMFPQTFHVESVVLLSRLAE